MVDSSSSAASANSASLIWSHTIASNKDGILIVGVSNRDNHRTVASVSYRGAPLTRIGSQAGQSDDSHVEMWYLLNPPVGTGTVAVNLGGGSTDVVAGAISFIGVNQGSPLRSFVSDKDKSSTASVTVPSGPGEVVVDTLVVYYPLLDLLAGSPGAGGGQTERWKIDTSTLLSSGVAGAGSTEPGAASVTMSWGLGGVQEWGMGAVSLRPAGC